MDVMGQLDELGHMDGPMICIRAQNHIVLHPIGEVSVVVGTEKAHAWPGRKCHIFFFFSFCW